MRSNHLPLRRRLLVGTLALIPALALTACGSDDGDGSTDPASQESAVTVPIDSATANSAAAPSRDGGTLHIGAIPDQDPEKLGRLYGTVADYLSTTLGVDVEYVPVTDYAAAVSLFNTGDLDMVWFGGLTGVQARLQTPGAQVVAQRDIDEKFRSVFIANADAGIDPFTDVDGLAALAGHRFTFGSESSTSGRLMPEYFLDQAGVEAGDFTGEEGFSGSHDATIDLVQAGSYEAGALNEQVWDQRLRDDKVDTAKVVELFRTPTYHDYHWVLGPSAVQRYGADFPTAVLDAFTALSADDPEQAEILDLFGAGSFIPTEASNYTEIEEIGRKLGLING